MHDHLVEILGAETADSLMEYFPPVGWADVATKRDLDAHTAATKRDLDAHADAFRRDLNAHADAFRRDLNAHADAFRRDLNAFKLEMRADLATQLAAQTRTMVFGMLSMSFATIGAVGAMVAVVR
jgi:hypothetical protein